MTLKSGEMIAQYRIREKLGEGGMGIVYKAEDTKLKRLVAIKFLPTKLTKDKQANERFIIEAQSASALDHPNICTIYDINETQDGQLYMVMAYYQGETLQKKIARGPLELNEAIHIGIQIAQGLAKAHAKGIVHRDIKPANIIVTLDMVVKILDFGVAKLEGRKEFEDDDTSFGTLIYMSPEQAQGEVVDDRTDIWSLGVLIYEMLAAQFPFKGDYEQALIYSILNEKPESISNLRSEIPSKFEQLINKALVKDPKARYQHMLDMLLDLREIKEMLQTTRKTVVPKTIKAKKSVKNISSLAVTLLIIILLAIYIFLIPKHRIADKKSILILPFQNLNTSPNQAYFSNGVTEDLITQVSKIKDLKVISYKASKEYKYRDKNLKDIAAELRVRNILQGSIRRQEDEVRITVKLFDVESDEILWAESYDRNLSDIFLIQSDVADRIASALEVQLSSKEKAGLEKIYTEDLTAYDYYLKGREYYYRYRQKDNEEAISLFRKCLKLDPDFALASAGLADAFVQQTLRFGLESYWLDSAIVRCNNALSMDANLAEGYKALGLIYYTKSWFHKALEANLKAVELNPNYDPAIANLGWIYTNLGRFDKALPLLHKAMELNPTNPSITVGLGFVYLFLRDLEKSSKWFEYTIDLQPNHQPNPVIGLILIDLLKARPAKALIKSEKITSQIRNDAGLFIAAGDAALISGNPTLASQFFEQAISVEPAAWHPITGVNSTTSMGFIFWKMNHKKQAEELFIISQTQDQETLQQGSEWWGIAYDLAALNAIQGFRKEAYKWLEKAIENGFRFYAWAQIDPLLENLREEEKFKNIMKQLKTRLDELEIAQL